MAKATAKNGASNVDPAPVRVGARPPGLAAATTDAAVSGPAALDVLVQAAVSSAIAADTAHMAGRTGRPGRGGAGWGISATWGPRRPANCGVPPRAFSPATRSCLCAVVPRGR